MEAITLQSELGRLVNFKNINGLELIGLLFSLNYKRTELNRTVVIHVHGNYGNFYNNKFLWFMSKTYTSFGIDFLTFNLSAHDGLCEGYQNGSLRYVGGAISKYEESILDIDAAIQYVKGLGYTRIILQGHSLGCDKVINYLLLYPNSSYELVLLSPVDSYAVQKRWLDLHKKITIDEQIKALRDFVCNSDDLNWLSCDEYGAEGKDADWIYRIPITRECLISILESSAFKYLNLDQGEDFTIKNRTLAFLGKNDGLQMSPQSEFSFFLHDHFFDLEIICDMQSDHDLQGIEEELAERIVTWINY